MRQQTLFNPEGWVTDSEIGRRLPLAQFLTGGLPHRPVSLGGTKLKSLEPVMKFSANC
jgi:hypothetical protein